MHYKSMKRLITIAFCFYLIFVISGCAHHLASKGISSSENIDSVCDLSTRQEIEEDFSPIKTEVLENGNKVVTYEYTSHYSPSSESRAEGYGVFYGLTRGAGVILEPLFILNELSKIKESKHQFAVTYRPDDSVLGCGAVLIDKPSDDIDEVILSEMRDEALEEFNKALEA